MELKRLPLKAPDRMPDFSWHSYDYYIKELIETNSNILQTRRIEIKNDKVYVLTKYHSNEAEPSMLIRPIQKLYEDFLVESILLGET